MKKVVSLLWILLFQICAFSQISDAEIINAGKLNWIRYKGEKEYFLSVPSRIKNEQDTSLVVHDDFSQMSYFVDVKMDKNANSFFSNFGMDLSSINEVDKLKLRMNASMLAKLEAANLSFDIDYLYGTNYLLQDETENESNTFDNMVVIYSEGFETNTVPGSNFYAPYSGSSCGWKDVSCDSYTGDWSIWCAGNGVACNNCINSGWYVGNMSTTVYPTSYINISNYTDVVMTFRMKLNIPDLDFLDNFKLYYSVANNEWFELSLYTSDSPEDEAGWVTKTVNIGELNQFAFLFSFASSSSLNDEGVYIDDINIYGNPIQSNIEENELGTLISPNPANEIIQVSTHLTPSQVDIYDINGRHVMKAQNSRVLNVSSLNSGVYVVKMKVGDEVITDRFIKE